MPCDSAEQSPALPHRQVSDGAAAIVDSLQSVGAVVVDDMFSTSLIAALKDELQPVLDRANPGANIPGEANEVFWGRNTVRFAGLAERSDAFIDVLLTPLVHEIAEPFMREVGSDYWLNTAQFIGIGPGEAAQELHRDNDLWQRVLDWGWPKMPELSFNSIIPLHDITEQMGATRVIPNSFRWTDKTRTPKPSETRPAEMSLGSMLVYSGNTFHGGGANTTSGQWRYAVQMSFTAGWLTPEEAHPFALSMERALKLPKKAQRLLGFRSYLPGGQGGYDRLWVKDYEDILANVET